MGLGHLKEKEHLSIVEACDQYINGKKLEDQNSTGTKEVHEEREDQDQVYGSIMGEPVLKMFRLEFFI